MRCPTRELLSSYVDLEASPANARWLEVHLAQCAECMRSVRFLRAVKMRLACLSTPEMPQDLSLALSRMAPGRIPDHLLASRPPRGRIVRRVCAWSVCAGITMAFAFWVQFSRREPQEIPRGWLLAEYRRDAAELPLAFAERVLPEDSPKEFSNGY